MEKKSELNQSSHAKGAGITTREKLYSKIGSFSTNSSISFLLDVLYSCVFSKDYQKNLQYKIKISERFDQRKTTNKVMQEE